MDKVCPGCGEISSRKKFAGDFCIDCYSSRIPLKVPRVVSIVECRFCGRIKDGKEWVPDNQKNVERLVLSETKGKFSNARVDLGQTPKITFVFEIGDSFVEIVRNFELKRGGAMCANCSRKTSGYFEAIIQLRGESDKIAKAQDRIGKKLEKTTVVSKVDELKEGVDLYVGSKKATALVLSDLGFHFTTSNKLFGVRDGQRIYRTTFCVRV
ncbi:MAG: NMD3-related protein [Candidatus Micrarchaeota archaeon]